MNELNELLKAYQEYCEEEFDEVDPDTSNPLGVACTTFDIDKNDYRLKADAPEEWKEYFKDDIDYEQILIQVSYDYKKQQMLVWIADENCTGEPNISEEMSLKDAADFFYWGGFDNIYGEYASQFIDTYFEQEA